MSEIFDRIYQNFHPQKLTQYELYESLISAMLDAIEQKESENRVSSFRIKILKETIKIMERRYESL